MAVRTLFWAAATDMLDAATQQSRSRNVIAGEGGKSASAEVAASDESRGCTGSTYEQRTQCSAAFAHHREVIVFKFPKRNRIVLPPYAYDVVANPPTHYKRGSSWLYLDGLQLTKGIHYTSD